MPQVIWLPRVPTGGWLWHDYLLPGNVTLLISQWKSGSCFTPFIQKANRPSLLVTAVMYS